MFLQPVDLYYPQLNYVSRERIDPLLSLLCGGYPEGAHCLTALQLAVLFLGMLVLLRQTSREAASAESANGRERRGLRAAAGALLALVLILLATPLDPFFLNVHWFPWLLAALLLRARSGSPAGFFLSALSGALWVYSAGALAFVGLTCGLLFSLGAEGRKAQPAWNDILLFAPLFAAAVYFLPLYPMPSYPPGARLADVSLLVTSPRPYFSPSLEPNPINGSLYLALLKGFSIRLLTAVMLIAVVLKPSVRTAGAFVVTTLCALLVVPSDLVLYPLLGNASPFRFLRSVLPGVAVFELPWKLTPICVVLVVLGAYPALHVKRAVAAALAALLLVLVDSRLSFLPGAPALSGYATEVSSPSPSRLSSSPSAFVASVYRDWLAARASPPNLRALKEAEDYVVRPAAEPHTAAAPLALDGRIETRWATGRPQAPGDTFGLDFERPTEISAVKLALGPNTADFPRGIAVEIRQAPGEEFRRVVSQPHWFGPLLLTSDGYPYFGRQADVVLWFPRTEICTSLRIVQLGRHEVFDWSIAEIELFGPKR